MLFSFQIWSAMIAVVSSLALAEGGPPLITDDPDTPGNGHVELNLALTVDKSSSKQIVQAPLLDLNYGVGERIQIKLETAWVFYTEEGANSINGAGPSLLGVKWRFLSDEAASFFVSVYPQLEFANFFSSAHREIVEPGTRIRLPIEMKKEFGSFGINPEVGHEFSTRGDDRWFCGLALGYTLTSSHELLTELHATTSRDGSPEEILIATGARFSLSENLKGLLSLGMTLKSPSGEAGKGFTYLGLGIRW